MFSACSPDRGGRLLHPRDGPGVHDGVGAMMMFLAATTLLDVMLIKNRFRPRGTAVIMARH